MGMFHELQETREQLATASADATSFRNRNKELCVLIQKRNARAQENAESNQGRAVPAGVVQPSAPSVPSSDKRTRSNSKFRGVILSIKLVFYCWRLCEKERSF
jgi:hypothetical protein